MSKDGDGTAGGVDLAEAIDLLRNSLLKARTMGSSSEIQLPVGSMTVELQVIATRTRDGKAGFAVPLVNVELGGSVRSQREAVQTVTVVFGAPLNRDGTVAKIAQAGNERKG